MAYIPRDADHNKITAETTVIDNLPLDTISSIYVVKNRLKKPGANSVAICDISSVEVPN